MKRFIPHGIGAALVLFCAGCALPEVPFNTLINRSGAIDRDARIMPQASPERALILPKVLIVADHARKEVQKYEVLLPAGKYEWEGSDGKFDFYRAGQPLAFRVRKDGKIAQARSAAGGICLANSVMNRIPAGIYIVFGDRARKITWNFGADFAASENHIWHYREPSSPEDSAK